MNPLCKPPGTGLGGASASCAKAVASKPPKDKITISETNHHE